MTSRARPLSFLAAALLAGGCVKSSTHNRALDLLAQSESRADRLEAELADERARMGRELAQLRAELERTRETLAAREADIVRLREEALELENQSYRLNTLLNQRGDEAESLRRRLDALAAVELEIRERNRIYQEVIGQFRSLIDAGQLSVSINRGRLVINLPQDILFGSGSADLAREGRTTLTEVAHVLAGIEGRVFQVEGHTDDVPIQTARFPSNWELSAARALSVVHLLRQEGVAPENVSGAAYGEHQPVASNDDAAGRRLNRRIEIVMLPNLDVIAGTTLPPGDGA